MNQAALRTDIHPLNATLEAGWIADVTRGKILCGSPSDPSWGVSTDTRKLTSGALFVALRGERFDAHDFLSQCKDAAGVVVDEQGTHSIQDLPPTVFVIVVRDTQKALLDMASAYLELLQAQVIAVTGSAGKTTTKDLLRALLSDHHVAATIGNFNNRIGLPLSVLNAPPTTEIFVAELGISEPGEMDELAATARPRVAILTSISRAHLEGLGNLDNVLYEKGRMILHMASDATTFISPCEVDVSSLDGIDEVDKAWSFGLRNATGAISRVEWTGDRYKGVLMLEHQEFEFELPLPGKHNLRNLLAAALGAHALGIRPNFDAIKTLEISKQRSNLAQIGDFRILDDTYNANPASMLAAFEAVHELKGAGNAHVVCGDMLELGPDSTEMHEAIGRKAYELEFSTLIGFGDFGTAYVRGANEETSNINTLATCEPEEAAAYLLRKIGAGDIILFKGSRGARTERVLNAVRSKAGGLT